MIRFTCDCGKICKAPDEYSGKRAVCPRCKKPVVVPDPMPAEPEEAIAYVPGLAPPGEEPEQVLDAEPVEPMPLPEGSPPPRRGKWDGPIPPRRQTRMQNAGICGVVGAFLTGAGGLVLSASLVSRMNEGDLLSAIFTPGAVIGCLCAAIPGALIGYMIGLAATAAEDDSPRVRR